MLTSRHCGVQLRPCPPCCVAPAISSAAIRSRQFPRFIEKMSLTKRMKKRQPKTEPCGIPAKPSNQSEAVEPHRTLQKRWVRKKESQRRGAFHECQLATSIKTQYRWEIRAKTCPRGSFGIRRATGDADLLIAAYTAGHHGKQHRTLSSPKKAHELRYPYCKTLETRSNNLDRFPVMRRPLRKPA